MSRYRRARGALLRLTLNRPIAVAVGVALAAPAAALFAGDFSWEGWLTDGLGLVLGATGAALIVAGLSGRKGDWTEEA